MELTVDRWQLTVDRWLMADDGLTIDDSLTIHDSQLTIGDTPANIGSKGIGFVPADLKDRLAHQLCHPGAPTEFYHQQYFSWRPGGNVAGGSGHYRSVLPDICSYRCWIEQRVTGTDFPPRGREQD